MRILLLFAAAAISAAAQSTFTFEAISIKPHRGGNESRVFPHFLPGGRFTSAGMPLRFIISMAYDVGFQSKRLSGGPDWLSSADGAYDIEATPPAGAFPPDLPSSVRLNRQRQMLRALLSDRFHMVVRRETKELPIYALLPGKGGPKLENSKMEEKDCGKPEVKISCHTIQGGRGRGLHGEAVTLADVATYVENWTDRPLIDKTGISGLFNVQTTGWLDPQPGAPITPGTKGEGGVDLADMPTLPMVFDKLGLKMEAQKSPVEVFVIERADKPSAN